MATASVTYDFVPSTTAASSEVDANFADLVSFLNTNVVHKDGTVAMTGALTLPGNPASALQAAPKQYADRFKTRYEQTLPGAGNWVSGNNIANLTITDPGYDINVWVAGTVAAQANTLAYWEMQVYIDANKAGGIIIPHASQPVAQTYAVLGRTTLHTTGTNCSIGFFVSLYSGAGGFATLANTGANNLLTAWYTAA